MTREERLNQALKNFNYYELAKLTMEEQNED